MTKCQYQQYKRVLNPREERIKQNENQIKSTQYIYIYKYIYCIYQH